MNRVIVTFLCAATAAVVGVGCGSRAEPSGGSAAPSAAVPAVNATAGTAHDDALATANAAADDLGRSLRARLLAAMGEGGPTQAVNVCTREASAIAAAVAERHHARVGRGSLRMRGATVAPDWVQAWLRAQGERPAAGVVGFARVEDGRARVLRPIAIEAPCLHCHGESVAPAVSALLAEHYPNDSATGYRLGDLRGALWAEVELSR